MCSSPKPNNVKKNPWSLADFWCNLSQRDIRITEQVAGQHRAGPMGARGMKFFFAIFAVATAGVTIVPGQAQVNVTQEHNHISRDGLYIDSAFTRTAAANLRRELNF